MTPAALAFLLAALAASDAAHSAPASSVAPISRPAIVTNPNWITKPSGEAMAQAYPALAVRMALEGRAVLRCEVDEAGRLRDCNVADELPAGMGFGAAALSLAPMFHMTPQTRDGQPVAGGRVNIPIRFALPKTPAMSEPAGPIPSAEALALGRRIIDLSVALAPIRGESDKLVHGFDALTQNGVMGSPLLVIAVSLRDDLPARLDELRDQLARLYATTFAEAQLRQIVAFYEGPGGKAAILDEAARDLNARINRDFIRREQTGAREAFCASRACAPDEAALSAGADLATLPDPIWSQEPGRGQVARALTPGAKALALGGTVRLTCRVAELGVLSDCAVASESPRGLALGTAAQALSGYYRLSPLQNGRRRGGQDRGPDRQLRPAIAARGRARARRPAAFGARHGPGPRADRRSRRVRRRPGGVAPTQRRVRQTAPGARDV